MALSAVTGAVVQHLAAMMRVVTSHIEKQQARADTHSHARKHARTRVSTAQAAADQVITLLRTEVSWRATHAHMYRQSHARARLHTHR